MNQMRYKGYMGSVEYTPEDGVLFGRIQGITPIFSYQADDVKKLNQEFKQAVNDYLELCKLKGKKPEKPFASAIRFKPDPEAYAQAISYADRTGQEINDVLDQALKAFLRQVA